MGHTVYSHTKQRNAIGFSVADTIYMCVTSLNLEVGRTYQLLQFHGIY